MVKGCFTMSILIKNGHVIDPATKTDGLMDVRIEEDRIAEVAKEIREEADEVIDAEGCYVLPGFIDLHVHLRDPGQEYKETVETGARAAARGGFTTVLAMPNTKPVVDNGDVVRYVHNKAKTIGVTNVLQVGAITRGQHGEELADIEDMVDAGIPAISEDGKTVMNAQLYREAMTLAVKYDIPVLAHCEDKNLAGSGVMNQDEKADELGMEGITNSVEDVIVARDILMAKETGARLHLCHCSTRDSVAMVAAAKAEGLPVSAEVCPHHFTLTSADIPGDDANYKMNPPLRGEEDRQALLQGLKDGVIDVIATDHAPHSREEKCLSMKKAPFGIVGLETAAALAYTELVDKGILTVMELAEKMSYNPAQVIGLDRGSLAVGKKADLVLFDPRKEYTIDAGEFASKGKNTPFHGKKVKGQVMATIFEGKLVYRKSEKH